MLKQKKQNLSVQIAIEKSVATDCLNLTDFNNDSSRLDLQHTVMAHHEKYNDGGVYLSEQRVKDLVAGILEIKQKNVLQEIQNRMSQINPGDRVQHSVELDKLKTIYTFNDTDLMKLSCWLTQVKRTAYNLEIKCPTALAFYSPKKATGKSTFMTLVKKAVLSSYQDEPHLKNFSLDDLFTRFKPIELIQDLVITIDEIGWMSKDITAQLKNLITETNEIQIEKKYKEPITAKKTANFMITTNDDPADLFYSDAHERRLSVIDNFDKKMDMPQNDLYDIIFGVWETAPLEYMYDTDALMEINLNRVRSHDDIFEAFFECNKYCEDEYGSKLVDDNLYHTWTDLYNLLVQSHIDVNKKLLRSYLDTTPDYFKKSIAMNGRLVRYKMTEKFKTDLIGKSESGQVG
jgi:hypothetical protein